MRAFALAGVVLVGCGGGTGADEPGTTPTPATTWDDVAPILERSCTGCHQEGGIGAFPLSTYDDAVPWAAMIAAAVEDRSMPPYLMRDDGTCGDFVEDEWLSDDEIATLRAWVDGGAPAGALDAPLVPNEPVSLDRRDLSLQTDLIVPEPEGDMFSPNDEYRCFLFTNDTGADFFLTGYEVEPGNARIVHHVLVMPVDPAGLTWDELTTNAEEIARLEAEDERPGWDCLGTVGGSARESSIPVTWAPGQGGVEYPDGVGVRVRSTDYLVAQIHYNLADPDTLGEDDSTGIHLRIEPSVDQEAYLALPDALLESMFEFPNVDMLPPGEESYDYTWELDGRTLLFYAGHPDPYGVDTFYLRGLLPHMHALGVKEKMRIKPASGRAQCAADVPAWDFAWQRFYFYAEPLEVSVDDVIEVTCTYDTSDQVDAVWPGWGTHNEMCLMGMMITD